MLLAASTVEDCYLTSFVVGLVDLEVFNSIIGKQLSCVFLSCQLAPKLTITVSFSRSLGKLLGFETTVSKFCEHKWLCCLLVQW